MQSVRIRQAVLVKPPGFRLPFAIRCADDANRLVGQEVSGPDQAQHTVCVGNQHLPIRDQNRPGRKSEGF